MAQKIRPKPMFENKAKAKKLNDLLAKWHEASLAATAAAVVLNEFHTEIVELCFPEGTRVEGSQNKMDVGHGVVLQCNQPWSRSLDNPALDAITVEENAEVLDKVISYVPKMSVSAWKLLTDNEKKLFHDVVIEKPGKPKLTLVRPKQSV